MATPSLAMIPSAYADSKVYSVLPNNGDGDFTFNRDSSATRIGQNGLIQTVGYFSSNKVSTIINGVSLPFNTFTDNGGGSYTCISTNTTYAGFEQPNSEKFAVSVGQVYRVTFDFVLNSGSYFDFFIGNEAVGSSFSGSSIRVSATGSYSFDLTITTANSAAMFVSQTNQIVNFTISNISVKEIQGDQPRLNYDISNGVVQSCPSLLLEPASTNSFPNSENYTVFSSASNGTGTNPVITSNYSVSPDGTQNADRIQFNRGSGTSSNDTSYVTKSLSLGTIDATLSIYLKTNDGTTKDVTLRLGAGLFDYDIIVTSDWQRFTLSGNTSVDRVQILLYGNKNSESADLSCFGTQIEALSYATSYIPTNGASQTRAAETCFGAGTASTFNDSEGVLYAEIAALVDSTSGGVRRLSLSDETNDNRIQILFTTTVGKISVVVKSGGLFQIDTGFSGYNTTDLNKIAIRYGSGVFKVYINGLSVFNDAGVSFSSISLDDLRFSNPSGSEHMYSRCKDLRVYNKALTDAQLQTLTTL